MQELNEQPNQNKSDLTAQIEVALKEGQKFVDEASASLDSAQAIALCDRAIDSLKRARELAGEDASAKNVVRAAAAMAISQRGHQHRYAGNHKMAAADLSQAIRYDPAYPDDYYYRGLSYLQMNDIKQATRDLNEFIRKAEDSLLKQDAEQILAELVPKDDPKMGLEHWRAEGQRLNSEASNLTVPKEGGEPDYAAAIALYNKALECFEKAKGFAPKDMMNNISYLAALKSQADCYIALGEYDLAIVNLNKALTQPPYQPGDIFKRGEAYLKLGKSAAAKEDFAMFVKIGKDPDLIALARQYLAAPTDDD